MKKAIEKHEKAVSKMKERIEALKSENRQDEEVLNQLKESYKTAVIDGSEEASAINTDISAKRSVINERKEQIELLEEVLPSVGVKEANAAARKYEKMMERQQAKASKAKENIEKAKQAYIESLAQAQREDDSMTNERREVRHILKYADEEVVQELDLMEERDAWGDEIAGYFTHNFYAVHPEEVKEKLIE